MVMVSAARARDIEPLVRRDVIQPAAQVLARVIASKARLPSGRQTMSRSAIMRWLMISNSAPPSRASIDSFSASVTPCHSAKCGCCGTPVTALAEASTSQPTMVLENSPISTTSTASSAGPPHMPKPGSCG